MIPSQLTDAITADFTGEQQGALVLIALGVRGLAAPGPGCGAPPP